VTSIVRVQPAAADGLTSEWLAERLREAWGSTEIVIRGRLRDASKLPALVYRDEDEVVGLATYELTPEACELVTIDAFRQHAGVGSALLDALEEEARAHGCRRLWVITTNDNLNALRFYQRRGLRLVAVYPGAVDAGRRLKPAIPRIGNYGIPIRDELELELTL
jgi:GNAT superfamily N-acetyltransferase